MGLRRWVVDALSTEYVRTGRGKKLERVAREPSRRAVDMFLLILAVLVLLTLLEALHIVVLRRFNETIFQAIASVIGALLGFFFGYRA